MHTCAHAYVRTKVRIYLWVPPWAYACACVRARACLSPYVRVCARARARVHACVHMTGWVGPYVSVCACARVHTSVRVRARAPGSVRLRGCVRVHPWARTGRARGPSRGAAPSAARRGFAAVSAGASHPRLRERPPVSMEGAPMPDEYRRRTLPPGRTQRTWRSGVTASSCLPR